MAAASKRERSDKRMVMVLSGFCSTGQDQTASTRSILVKSKLYGLLAVGSRAGAGGYRHVWKAANTASSKTSFGALSRMRILLGTPSAVRSNARMTWPALFCFLASFGYRGAFACKGRMPLQAFPVTASCPLSAIAGRSRTTEEHLWTLSPMVMMQHIDLILTFFRLTVASVPAARHRDLFDAT